MLEPGRTRHPWPHPVIEEVMDQERWSGIAPIASGYPKVEKERHPYVIRAVDNYSKSSPKMYPAKHFGRRDKQVGNTADPRGEIGRDSGRLLHSFVWRRLQGKVQLFPGLESDFFRNRMTHSLEVGQIARSIALRLNKELSKKHRIDPDLVQLAGWCHDLGHPPFGHTGEQALQECMAKHGGFEGNAMTLRLAGHLEPGPEPRYGLNFTMRTYAALLKYDNVIPADGEPNNVLKGYFREEAELVREIKKAIGAQRNKSFKTVECAIMDLADDIAYSTYDLEDALYTGFLDILDFLAPDPAIVDAISEQLWSRDKKAIRAVGFDKDGVPRLVRFLLFRSFKALCEINFSDLSIPARVHRNEHGALQNAEGMSRAIRAARRIQQEEGLLRRTTSYFVGRLVRSTYMKFDRKMPWFSKIRLPPIHLLDLETRKLFIFESIIRSHEMQIVSERSKHIVKNLFELLASGGRRVLPPDVCQRLTDEDFARKTQKFYRAICDYIAGMTDRYALELYGRFTSEKPASLFKPVA